MTKTTTPLMARLGLSHPIIQAPMAGTSTPALAGAVSNAGGLGSLGVAAMNAAAAREAVKQTRALTQGAFNVNLFCHKPAQADAGRERAWIDYLAPSFAEFGAQPPAQLREIYTSFVVDEDMLQMLLDERPAVVSFHFGLPDAKRIEALHAAGCYLMASATSLDEARRIAAAGIDAVVAQGVEAGGHRGIFDPDGPDEQLGTFALARLLAARLPLPVIAAGGIMDGAGISAALSLGAQAAQLGTAFVSCPESNADAAYRQALLAQDDARVTVMTRSISGRPARGFANRLTALGAAPECPALPDYPMVYDAGKALHAAAKAKGSADFAAQWAGQGFRLSRSLPAADLVRQLRAEMDA